MKKQLIAILLVTLLLGCVILNGCKQIESEYKIGDYIVRTTKEYGKWSDEWIHDKKMPTELTVTLGNETLTGTYRHSYRYMAQNYYSAQYRNSEQKVDFSIDPKKHVVSANWLYRGRTPVTDDNRKSEAECVQIVREWIASFADIQGYEEQVKYDEGYESYDIIYTKYIGQFKSADSAIVSIKENGIIFSYYSYMFGRIPNDLDLDQFDMEEVEKAITTKLHQIYDPQLERYSNGIQYSDYSYKLTLLDNNEIGLVCYVTIIFNPGTSLELCDPINLVISKGS